MLSGSELYPSSPTVGKQCRHQTQIECICCSFHSILSTALSHIPYARCSSVVRAFAHQAMGRRTDPSRWTHFLFQPVLHDWCNKGCGMCYPVYGMMHIKEPLLLIGKNSPCGGSRFPLLLSEWSITICLMPYNCK